MRPVRAHNARGQLLVSQGTLNRILHSVSIYSIYYNTRVVHTPIGTVRRCMRDFVVNISYPPLPCHPATITNGLLYRNRGRTARRGSAFETPYTLFHTVLVKIIIFSNF